MAAQLKWLRREMRDGPNSGDCAVIEHVAEQLEGLGLAAGSEDAARMADGLHAAIEECGLCEDGDDFDRTIYVAMVPAIRYLRGLASGLPQIRAALVEALQHHGAPLEDADEPGLPSRQRAFERQLRDALKLLDRAA
jgi:hypothetical protein